jgi:hypothetical protein
MHLAPGENKTGFHKHKAWWLQLLSAFFHAVLSNWVLVLVLG